MYTKKQRTAVTPVPESSRAGVPTAARKERPRSRRNRATSGYPANAARSSKNAASCTQADSHHDKGGTGTLSQSCCGGTGASAWGSRPLVTTWTQEPTSSAYPGASSGSEVTPPSELWWMS